MSLHVNTNIHEFHNNLETRVSKWDVTERKEGFQAVEAEEEADVAARTSVVLAVVVAEERDCTSKTSMS